MDGLNSLNLGLLRLATRLYLELAYAGSEIPEVVRRRADWPEGVEPAALLTRPPFEHVNRTTPAAPPIFALRLGNDRYPHMKLQVQTWPNADGFLLSVNTHDQLATIAPAAAEAEAYRAIQAINQRHKEAIERAWDEAKLPTFLRYLRDYLESQGPVEA